MKTIPLYDKPTMKKINRAVEICNKIPPTVFHTWSVLNILADKNNFVCVSLKTLIRALSLSEARTRERIQQVLLFKLEKEHIVELYTALQDSVSSSNNIIYKPGEKVNIDKNGNYNQPKDQFGHKLPVGFFVKEIPFFDETNQYT